MLFPSPRDRHRGKDFNKPQVRSSCLDQGQWSQQQSPKIHPAAPDVITPTANAMPTNADKLAAFILAARQALISRQDLRDRDDCCLRFTPTETWLRNFP